MERFNFKTFWFINVVIVLFSFLAIGCGGGGGGGDSDNGDNGDTSGNANWTYMVYIAGDNNLSSAAVGDINEMEQVGSNNDVNIVVQVEFSRQYSPDINNYNTLRGRITRDSNQSQISSQFEDTGNQNMGDGQTLTDFIVWAAANYPADHYALVLWDHGAGWKISRNTGGITRGALQDATSDSFMSLPDIAAAVNNSGIHLDLINFDACLMAMYEVAYEFNGLADYMVFAEEVEPGEGDPYDTILQALVNSPNMSASNLAQTITSRFKAFYQAEARTEVTKSAVDMAYTATLHTELGELVQLMNTNVATERPNIQSARDASVNYEYPENHDLGDFLEKLANESSNNDIITKTAEIRSTLSTMVISNDIYSPDASDSILDSTGLAIFLPRRDQVTDSELSRYALLASNQARDADPNSWGGFVNLLITGDETGGMPTQQTGVGNFVIWLEWDSDADLDLLIWEADGSWAAPYIGSSSANGFLSEDSLYSGVSAEFYAAAETIEAGNYNIFVNCYQDGSTTNTTAYIYLLDPPNGINDFVLQSQRIMNLSYPAPDNWSQYQSEWYNVADDVYSDWWWPGYLPRSTAREVSLSGLNQSVKFGNKSVHFITIPGKNKLKKPPTIDEEAVEIIKQRFYNPLR